jgi:hypothetical protein
MAPVCLDESTVMAQRAAFAVRASVKNASPIAVIARKNVQGGVRAPRRSFGRAAPFRVSIFAIAVLAETGRVELQTCLIH